MICVCCGAEISDKDKYCKNCGQNNSNFKANTVEVQKDIENYMATDVVSSCTNSNSEVTKTTSTRSSTDNAAEKPQTKSFLESYKLLWRNYFDFSGVMSRQDFWRAFIVNIILSCIPFVGQFYAVVALIGGLSCCVRRLHDTGRSGLYLFVALIPIVGAIMLIIAYCDDTNSVSQYRKNE